MTNHKKKYFFFFLCVILCGFLSIFLIFHRPFIKLDDNIPESLIPYAKRLVHDMNQQHFFNMQHSYTLYVANFDNHSPVIQPNTEHKNILWLGSHPSFDIDKLKFYDIILTSSLFFHETLQKYQINSYYFPLFAMKNIEKKSSHPFVAIIGNPPFVEDILIKKNIIYKKYLIGNYNKVLEDMSQIKFAIVENTFYAPSSSDIHPLFLELANQNIPLVTHWSWPDVEEPINLFNDTIFFYMHNSDAENIINSLYANVPADSVIEKIRQNKNLMSRYYSLKQAVYHLDSIINHNKYDEAVLSSQWLNIDLPVATGHSGSGDYWLAQDLKSELRLNSFDVYFNYFNSPVTYPSYANIIIRGFIPVLPKAINGKINILYLAYATEDVLLAHEQYVETIRDMLSKQSIDAVVVASLPLYHELLEQGLRVYYAPQFTNPERFYPDINKDLKSEVLFVGNNFPYRKAAMSVFNAGLPITIYGDYWPEGMAKSPYIDNRILRKYYSSAKIVLNDAREGMKKSGFIINRIFDATACGTLVISDYMKEIEDVYGDSVPMWKTEDELVDLVKYYLDPAHENERREKAERARQITLNNFTSKIVAQKFQQIIKKLKKEKAL